VGEMIQEVNEKIGKRNENYVFRLEIVSFNSANYAYVMEKLRQLMDDDTYIHSHSNLQIIPHEDDLMFGGKK
jgi:Fe-S cluster assembly iron-binding protein IscA